jgi:hypothetical protein
MSEHRHAGPPGSGGVSRVYRSEKSEKTVDLVSQYGAADA